MKINISKESAKFVKPDSPREAKMMAARGVVPLSSREVIRILFILCHDKDKEVKINAVKTFKTFSPRIMGNLLEGDIEPEIIDMAIRYHDERGSLSEKVIYNRNTSDNTLSFLASREDVKLLEMISLNHERLSRAPGLIDTLLNNTAVTGVLRQKLLEYRSRTIIQQGEITKPAGGGQDIPDGEKSREEEGEKAPPDDKEQSRAEGVGGVGGAGDKKDVDEKEEEKDGRSLLHTIQLKSVAEKIKLATTGNKEERTILLRDSSKVVVAAVIKGPKITEDEILTLAKSKQVSDEVIRLITMNRDWVKNHSIKHALVCNPKTPIGIALKYLNYLSKKEIKDLARNKNIPSVIANGAKKILDTREKRGN